MRLGEIESSVSLSPNKCETLQVYRQAAATPRNRRGEVTRLLGGDAEPEADATPHGGENGKGGA